MATARRGNSKLFFATFGKKADLGGIALKFRTSGFCVLWAAALTAFAIPAVAADIKVLCDSPLQPAISKVADLFRQETHNELHLVFDPSPAVKKRIEEGEAADVVIVQPEFVEELSRAGKVDASGYPLVGRVGIGLGNRRDSPAYDISTPEKLRQTLLGADLVAFNSVMSGNWFAKVLDRLDIAETLRPKIVRASPNGIFEPVLKGKGNDFVAGTMPLIATTPGIKLLGPLPGDLQNNLTYTAVLMKGASDRVTAESFIRFLSSPNTKQILAANGVS